MQVLDRAFAAVYDPARHGCERAGLGALRSELLAGLSGHVVDIGAGTGANLGHLDAEVTRVTLLEPSAPMVRRLRQGLREHPAPFTTQVITAPAERIPLPDGSVDAVVSTLVLCSVADLPAALGEIRRILRAGGELRVIEHVRGEGATAGLQRLIEPVWKIPARGCHLTRDTRTRIAEAGFDVSDLRPWRIPGCGPAAPAITGIARRL